MFMGEVAFICEKLTSRGVDITMLSVVTQSSRLSYEVLSREGITPRNSSTDIG